jgi:uncharacterized protein GlcG (DUF336 family)
MMPLSNNIIREHGEEVNNIVMTHTVQSKQISYASASAMVLEAIAKATSIGINVVVSVIDTRASLKAYGSMDGAVHVAIAASQAKAYTALMGLGSGDLAQSMENQIAQMTSLISLDRIVMLGGGLPIILDGEVVGAIGVGGGTMEQDVACAQAALNSLK